MFYIGKLGTGLAGLNNYKFLLKNFCEAADCGPFNNNQKSVSPAQTKGKQMDCFGTPADHRIFILGESLFAEGIAQILVIESGFEIVGRSSDIESTEKAVRHGRAKLVIVESMDRFVERSEVLKLLIEFPDIKLIYVDVQGQSIQFIASYKVQPEIPSILNIVNLIQLTKQ